MTEETTIFQPGEIETISQSTAELTLRIISQDTEFLQALGDGFNSRDYINSFCSELADSRTLLVKMQGWHNLEMIRDIKGSVCRELHDKRFSEKH